MRALSVPTFLILLSLGYPPPAGAQPAVPPSQGLLRRADAAYSAGERELAQKLYQAVLASDPNNARATYQLARLAPQGSAQAVALLRRYVKLEPEDPWGYMALGDALAKAGALAEAIEQYGEARRRAPNESDVYEGLGRILRDAGRTDELVKTCEEWVSRQPKNARAWLELGRARQRAGRHVEAAEAYAESASLKPDARTESLLENALAQSAFSLRPYVGRSADTDDNRTSRLGLDGEWQLTKRSRLGLHAERAEVGDPFTSGTADEFALTASWQPISALRLDGLAGTARLRADLAGQEATSHPLRRLRLRWRSPQAGPALELRLAQNPLVATPGLVAQPVELTEIKGSFESPLGGPFRARVRGLSGRLEAATDVNHRSGYQLGPVYRWLPAAELSLSYSDLGYDHPTAAGYFAPRRAQVVEVGTYFEYEGLSPLTFALDAGLGQQNVERFGEPSGGWIRTVRFWGLASWSLKPGVNLDLELEHYDSPVAGVAVTPTSTWKYNSVMLSLRFGVLPQTARSFLSDRARPSAIPAR